MEFFIFRLEILKACVTVEVAQLTSASEKVVQRECGDRDISFTIIRKTDLAYS